METFSSTIHRNVQKRIEALFPKGEVKLEHRFPTIKRIADCYLETKKIVFEIQFSPITAKEVASRNRDYGSLGIGVIWILHDLTFNRHRPTEAECFLADTHYHYTNIDWQGEGFFYTKPQKRTGLYAKLLDYAIERLAG